MNKKIWDVVYWSIVIGLAFAPLLYFARYDFGLVSPKFEKGDCVDIVYEDEFGEKHSSYVITRVGKRNYQTALYLDNIITDVSIGTNRFEDFDSHGTLIDCPTSFRIIK